MQQKQEESLVSIIVPIYKVEEYLDRCVKSIINQTYKNIEIILVDDGSPDQCPTICDRWSLADSRVKVIHKKNGGLSDARNEGIKIALGEYIAFIDSDDWIDNNWIEALITEIKRKECEIAIGWTRLCSDEDKTILLRGMQKGVYSNIDIVYKLIQENGVFPTACDKLYKKELVTDELFKIGKINEDEFWTWKILWRATKIVCCENTNYNYFQNSESIMGSKYSIKRLDGLDARLERYIALQQVEELGNICNKRLIWDCIYHMQQVCLWIKGEEKKNAIEHIKNVADQIDWKGIHTNSLKEFIWIRLFEKMPIITAKIRNKIGVGV